MTRWLDKLYSKDQAHGIKNAEFERNMDTIKEWNKKNGEELSKLVDRASNLEKQTTQFNISKNRRSSNEAIGLFCVALSLSTILIGAALMAYISVTLGAIITAVGCLGLAISLYKTPRSLFQNVSETSQYKETGRKLM